MDAFEALADRFGDRLALVRDGNRVCWSFDGQSAVVEVGPSGEIDATFVDRAAHDGVTARQCFALYRPRTAGYSMNARGSESLARDVADFFCGVREPWFAFSEVLG